MDKWDEASTRIKQAILAEEPDAALTAGLDLFAEVGRTMEQMSADLDRIATALETRDVVISGDEGIPPELQHDEPELEHDL